MARMRALTSRTLGEAGVGHGVKKAKHVGKKNVNKRMEKARLMTEGILEVGGGVEVKDGQSGETLQGKVVEVGQGNVLVHYVGWNSRHDAWLDHPCQARRPLTDQTNTQPANSLQKQEKVHKMEEIEIEKEEEELDEEQFDPLSSLCEYEKIRLENIRDREAMFAELDLSTAKQDVAPPASRPGAAPSRRGLQSARREKEVLPRRQSSRLAGGKVQEIERYVSVQVAETARSEVPARTLSLEEFTEPACSGILSSLSASLPAQYTGKSCLTRLTITPERVAKVVPDRIFSVALHPGADRLVAACGGKWGAVGLWECENNEAPAHGVRLLNYHSRPVNCLTWDSSASHQLISTSYDGTMRQLDVTKQESSLLYHDSHFLEAGGWTSFHCQPDANTFLTSLGNQGAVARVDRRVGPRPVSVLGLFDRLHAKSISSHPMQPHLLLTGTNKGGCFIFDLRATPKARGLLAPVTELLGAARTLSSCQFSPTGGQVVTLSSDDKLRLYNTTNIGLSILPCAQVKHNNHTGRWLTPFRASWHPARENLLAMGSMERPRQIELWSTEGAGLVMAGRLQGEELGSVASIVALHPSRDAIVGGNSSGRLHLFM